MNPNTEQDTPAVSALPHVQEVLRTAQEELSGLLRRREDIMKRIGKVKQMVSSMAGLFGDCILYDELRTTLDGRRFSRQKGFTRACRQILMQSRTPLSIRAFIAELRRKFPDLATRHKDLSASVTTVLHRLAAYGEARWAMDDHGGRVWEWVADTPAYDDDEDLLASLKATVQPQPPRI